MNLVVIFTLNMCKFILLGKYSSNLTVFRSVNQIFRVLDWKHARTSRSVKLWDTAIVAFDVAVHDLEDDYNRVFPLLHICADTVCVACLSYPDLSTHFDAWIAC